MTTSTRSRTTYVNDEIDSEISSPSNGSMNHPSKAQTVGESGSAEENVVEEVMGTGDSSETETYGAGEETTEADEAANHKSMSSPSVSRTPATDAEGEDEESGEAEKPTDTESVFETVTGWDESTLTETTGQEEAVIEAYYADAEATEGGEEFFGLIAAAFVPLVKAVLPSLAGAAVNQGIKSLRLRKILARLSKLGISPKKRRETDEESAEELDEATFSALEQQLETLEVVIGQDDRVRITNTKATPWKRICHLKIQTATGKFYLGTGFFIGPRTIVTAGHCVYIHSQGGWAQKITVTPGRNATETPFKSYTATSFRSVKGWVTDKSRNYDYGVIILPKSAAIPSEIGAFGFGSYSNQSLLNKKLNTAGYPGDKPAGTMWFHGRKAKAVTSRTITYDIDTAGGQSGSAVWVREGSNGKRIVVGIHTNGALSGNSATRITKRVFENLKKWRAEGGLS